MSGSNINSLWTAFIGASETDCFVLDILAKPSVVTAPIAFLKPVICSLVGFL